MSQFYYVGSVEFIEGSEVRLGVGYCSTDLLKLRTAMGKAGASFLVRFGCGRVRCTISLCEFGHSDSHIVFGPCDYELHGGKLTEVPLGAEVPCADMG